MYALPLRYHPVLVAALAILVYTGALDNALVLDDQAIIRDNPIVHRADLGAIFTTDYWAGFHGDHSGLYRPLTVLGYALQYQLFGDAPFSYHLLNILLHAGIALLLYRFCLRLTQKADLALASGLLFAAHPALSEAVCSVVGRADLQATAFALGALILHQRQSAIGVGLCCALALLSKESAIVLPALLLLVDAFQYRTFSQKSYSRSHLLCAASALAYLAWRHHVLGAWSIPEIDRLDNPLVELDPGLRLLNATALLGRYLGLLVLPITLSADYSYAALPLIPQLPSPQLALVLLGLALFGLSLVYTWRHHPWPCFGLCWLLLALAPVANILLPIGTILAERLLYLPAIGFCIGLAALVQRAPRPHLVLLALLALLALRTTVRVADWQNSHTLFTQTTQDYPQSARAWRALGKAHFERGEDEQGQKALERALAILPDYYEVLNDLGAYHLQKNQHDRALGNLEACLRLRPDFPPAWLNLGLAFYQLDRKQEAQQAFAQALHLNPHYAQAAYNLGVLALEAGDSDRAATFFTRTLELDPTHSEARHNLDKLRASQL